MRRRVYAVLPSLAAVTIVALMLVFVVVLSDTEGTKSPAASTKEIASAAGSPAESIAVHGHWTMEVRNPDGTLVERRDFDNAITPTGKHIPAQILGRQWSVGGWNITAGFVVPSESPFMEPRASGRDCEIVEPSYTATHPWVFKNLTVSVPSSGEDIKITLSGTAIAQRDGKINRVGTSLNKISKSNPPSSTYFGGMSSFTRTTLDDVVNVSAGQSITFTVVIGFS